MRDEPSPPSRSARTERGRQGRRSPARTPWRRPRGGARPAAGGSGTARGRAGGGAAPCRAGDLRRRGRGGGAGPPSVPRSRPRRRRPAGSRGRARRRGGVAWGQQLRARHVPREARASPPPGLPPRRGPTAPPGGSPRVGDRAARRASCRAARRPLSGAASPAGSPCRPSPHRPVEVVGGERVDVHVGGGVHEVDGVRHPVPHRPLHRVHVVAERPHQLQRVGHHPVAQLGAQVVVLDVVLPLPRDRT